MLMELRAECHNRTQTKSDIWTASHSELQVKEKVVTHKTTHVGEQAARRKKLKRNMMFVSILKDSSMLATNQRNYSGTSIN